MGPAKTPPLVMNQSSQNENGGTRSETDAIREDIDVTRRRMDNTMDALGNRLQPQHLIDEVLGFFRRGSETGDSKFNHLRENISQGASTALHSVTDAVKSNPMPALLIGAGVAWMIYESRRNKSGLTADGDYYGYSREGEELRYDPDTHFDRPLEYPTGSTAGTTDYTLEGESKLGQIKGKIGEKASAATGAMKEKISQVGEAAREKAGALRQRAGEMTTRMKDGTHEAYVRTRQRVVTTADQHPVEVGLVALAAGVIAGLALPTPNAVNRYAGSTADQLRDRTRASGREMLEKGKRVAQAAVTAAKDEAQSQGLTPERLREQAHSIADRAVSASQQSARQEGLINQPGSQSGSPTNDPTVARPAV
jgi:hypothetical protein